MDNMQAVFLNSIGHGNKRKSCKISTIGALGVWLFQVQMGMSQTRKVFHKILHNSVQEIHKLYIIQVYKILLNTLSDQRWASKLTNPQFFGPILLLHICKIHRCASPQIANPHIFMINLKITNLLISSEYSIYN